MIPFSVLDLSPIVEGGDPAQSFRNTVDLAQHAEGWGYERYWLAEHHNLPGVASSATAVLIGHVAGATRHIRVGSGGIMLPNHAPLLIAEQFGTLASLYPGRIDLGLGRAPGTDQRTSHALRRDIMQAAENFPQDVVELQALLGPVRPNQVIRAVPGAGTNVPLWILGSSLFGAHLAAMLGLPFAFASHFAPAALLQALEVYRSRFEPSAQLQKPYVMVGAGIYAADTDAEARRLITSAQQQFVNLRRGMPTPLKPPVDDMEPYWTPMEKRGVEQALAVAAVGAPDTIERRLREIIAETGADELMLTGQIYDHKARLHSFEIAAEVRERLAKT